ncbi:hypothetical protein EVAR_37442_1 [Eumeta japonica]|uniref:Uncharacterized protein n=1 Tax=Eumeta variegata TaxID=151549 RepID=A0A4C1X2E2_EUMVA|nr:hypothetical protein EVAR_37442_1 [Eumeta japonica]
MSDPAYSLGLAPCDFEVKDQLRVQRFSTSKEAVIEYEKHVSKTLETNHSHSAFQENSNQLEHSLDTLFYYGVLVPTIRLHHQTLKITHGESTSEDN